jgi:hypothetical protein
VQAVSQPIVPLTLRNAAIVLMYIMPLIDATHAQSFAQMEQEMVVGSDFMAEAGVQFLDVSADSRHSESVITGLANS